MQELSHAEWFSLFVLALNAAGEANLQGHTNARQHYEAVAAKCSANANAIEHAERERDAKLVGDAVDRRAYREATSLSKLYPGIVIELESANGPRASYPADYPSEIIIPEIPEGWDADWSNEILLGNGRRAVPLVRAAEFVGENFTAALARRRAENPELDLDEHGFDRSESSHDPDEDRTP